MANLDRLLERQAKRLDKLDDKAQRDVLRAFEDARRELAEQLRQMHANGRYDKTPFTARQIEGTLVQADVAIRDLRRRLTDALDTQVETARDASLRDLLQIVRAAEPDFRQAVTGVPIEVLQRVSADGELLLHRYSVDRYSSDALSAIQQALRTSVAKKDTAYQMVERLAGRNDSVLAGRRARASLIVRNELSQAYNGAHLRGIEVTADILDGAKPKDADPLLKRIDEFRDKRTHPISYVLDGQTRKPDEPFEASKAEVRAWAKRLGKKRVSGILDPWLSDGASYTAQNLPAHHNERGRIHSWRASWAS